MEKQKVTIEQWKDICKKYDRWCNYDEVKDYTYEQAEAYVKHMPVWGPV